MLTKNELNKEKFKSLCYKRAITVKQLVDKYNKGAIEGDQWLYDIVGMLEIAEVAGKGMWFEAVKHFKPENRKNAIDVGTMKTNKIIKNAFD